MSSKTLNRNSSLKLIALKCSVAPLCHDQLSWQAYWRVEVALQLRGSRMITLADSSQNVACSRSRSLRDEPSPKKVVVLFELPMQRYGVGSVLGCSWPAFQKSLLALSRIRGEIPMLAGRVLRLCVNAVLKASPVRFTCHAPRCQPVAKWSVPSSLF